MSGTVLCPNKISILFRGQLSRVFRLFLPNVKRVVKVAIICIDDSLAPPPPDAVPDAAGLPYTSFDHSKAHFYRYDEQVSLCLERLR